MVKTWLHERSPFTSDHLLGGSITLLAFIIFLASPVRQLNDSKYSMLVSQSVLQWRSFALDHYRISILPPTILREDYVQNGDIYQLEVVDNHIYYFFPPGSAVLSLPYVAIANWFGVSAVTRDGAYDLHGETTIQTGLAALLMALLSGVFYYTSRLALSKAYSILIALAGAFGTQVWSTASRAMYSDTWAILLLGAVVLMLLGHERSKLRINAVLLATLLSWMYFVSPVYAVHVIIITVYVFIFQRRRFLAYAVTGSLWLAGFIIYSWHNFKTVLPHYFMGSRLSLGRFLTALPANIMSPSRGLLVYVPVLAFVLYLLLRYRRFLTDVRLAVLAFATMAAHVLVVSCFSHWWGGYGYGPRFTTGLVPWMVLSGILGIKAMLESRKEEPVRSAGLLWQTFCGGFLLAFGVFANGRAAISPAGQAWNTLPTNVDQHPERVWDWRQPQFLAGIINPPLPATFPWLNPGERIGLGNADADKYLGYGWSGPEQSFRWSDGSEAAIIFSVDAQRRCLLTLRLGAFLVPGRLDEQRVSIAINGHPLETLTMRDEAAVLHSLVLPPATLQQRNVLKFLIPGAAAPASFGLSNDQRLLGIRLEWIQLVEDLPDE